MVTKGQNGERKMPDFAKLQISFQEALQVEKDAGLTKSNALHEALSELHGMVKAANRLPAQTKEPVKELLERLELERIESVKAQQKSAQRVVYEIHRKINDAAINTAKDILKKAGRLQPNDVEAADEYVVPRAQSEGASETQIDRRINQAREDGYQNGWNAGKKVGSMEGFEKGKTAKTSMREKRWAAEGFDEGKRVGFVEGRKIGKENGIKFGMEEGIKEGREKAKKVAGQAGAVNGGRNPMGF